MERLNTNIVGPDGPYTASMCLIGEAPGAAEDYQCLPFKGPAGQLLDRALKAAELSRGEVLLYNVFVQRPPNNSIMYFYRDNAKRVLTEEGQEHLSRLEAWLHDLADRRETTGQGPNVVVALGAVPMYHLTGKRRISKWRGSVLPCILEPRFKVYVTYHPSYVNRLINERREKILASEKKKRQQNVLPIFIADLKRAKEQSVFPEIPRVERTFEISLSHGTILSYLERLNNVPKVAVDIETLPGPEGPIVWCIGFAHSRREGFCVPILYNQKFHWTLHEEAEIWRAISKLFLNPSVIKIFQNGWRYDLPILAKYYGLRLAPNTYRDTMISHHAVYPYMPMGLEFLASIYTWEPYYKDEGKVAWGSRTDEAEFNYNVKDCCVTYECDGEINRHVREAGVAEGAERTHSITPSLISMMTKGVLVDQERKASLGERFESLANEAQTKVIDEIGYKINLNSSDQKKKLLYGFLGLDLQYHPVRKNVTTDKDALQKLKQLYPNKEILQHILDYQKYSKLASTYTSMEVSSDGRIYTSYGFVSTWRLNSSESQAFGGGGNLQNIPARTREGKLVRELFIPDPPCIMLASDRRQAEAMIVAWEAEDLARIEAFLAGDDVHWLNACLIFGLPTDTEYIPDRDVVDKVTGMHTTMKKLRAIGKTVVHAGNYGMGPFMLQTILAREGFIFPFPVCRDLLLRHKGNNPHLLEWQRAIREEVRATRTLTSAIGRRREFLGRMNDNLYRAAYAFSPQNTVGELTEITIQRCWDHIPDFLPLLNVHDEVVGQCLPDALPTVIPRIKEVSSYPLEIKGRILDIPVDFKTGPNWGQLTELPAS